MNRSLTLARMGNKRAQESVVEALQPRLRKMAFYYAKRTGEDPDDLLQEAWLGLLDALPGLDMAIGSPEYYLVQRARWRLLDFVKKAKLRQCTSLEEIVIEPVAAASGDCPIETAAINDFLKRLKGSQQVIVDCLIAGLTWREAGERLGCSSANIAYHMRQIKQQYEIWSSAG